MLSRVVGLPYVDETHGVVFAQGSSDLETQVVSLSDDFVFHQVSVTGDRPVKETKLKRNEEELLPEILMSADRTGQTLVTLSDPKRTQLVVYVTDDVNGLEEFMVHKLHDPEDEYLYVKLTPDGEHMLVAQASGIIAFWRLDCASRIAPLWTMSTAWGGAVAMSGDGKRFAHCPVPRDEDATEETPVSVCLVKNQAQVSLVPGLANIESLAFSENGNYLAIALEPKDDKTEIQLWDVSSYPAVHKRSDGIPTGQSQIQNIFLSNDCQVFAVTLLDLEPDPESEPVEPQPQFVSAHGLDQCEQDETDDEEEFLDDKNERERWKVMITWEDKHYSVCLRGRCMIGIWEPYGIPVVSNMNGCVVETVTVLSR